MKPIFISGIGRSGTSALIKAVAEHCEVKKPKEIGEAPFVREFLDFIHRFEYTSAAKDYNLKNYKIEDQGKREVFSNLMVSMLYGENPVKPAAGEKYWVAKTSLPKPLHHVANDVFGEVRTIHIVRNGIEVVNSARKFAGFSSLDFTALCKRWSDNLKACQYFHADPLSVVIRHQDMVGNGQALFDEVFNLLGMKSDDSAAKFIDSTLFNSSFDESAQIKSAAEVFKGRLECWHTWTEEEQQTFIEMCDPFMVEYGFARPYADCSGTEHSGVWQKADEITRAAAKPISVQINKGFSAEVCELVEGKMSAPQLSYHVSVSEKSKFVYVENPKVASTTTLRLLAEKEDAIAAAKMSNPHDKANSPLLNLRDFALEKQSDLLFSEDYFRFTMLRNPYSRLLSAYISKIERNLKPKLEILSVINAQNDPHALDITQQVSFEEFVDVVASMDDLEMNPRWKPQAIQTLFEDVSYDAVVYFEDLKAGLSDVWSRIYGESLGDLLPSSNTTSATSQLGTYYTQRTAQLVQDRFARDFELFGYSDDMSVLTPIQAVLKQAV